MAQYYDINGGVILIHKIRKIPSCIISLLVNFAKTTSILTKNNQSERSQKYLLGTTTTLSYGRRAAKTYKVMEAFKQNTFNLFERFVALAGSNSKLGHIFYLFFPGIRLVGKIFI